MFRRNVDLNWTALGLGIGIGIAASNMMRNGGRQAMNMFGRNNQQNKHKHKQEH
ncbi:hypothetical protein ACFDTO_23945 [Microbacteriaceae bacterium 4G12]